MSKSIKEIYEMFYGNIGSIIDPFFTTIVKTQYQSMTSSVWTGSASLDSDPSIIKNNSLFNIIFKKQNSQPKVSEYYYSTTVAPAGYSSGSYSYSSLLPPQSGSYSIGVDIAI